MLENLAIDASAASGETALIAVGSGVAPNYAVRLDGVSVRGPGKGRLDGIAMAPGTFADDGTIRNSDFAGMGVVVAATGEQEPKGWYPMERLTIAGSRFVRVAMVAANEADLVATLRWGFEWDIAAATLIAREAGASVSDAFGAPLAYNKPDPRAFGLLVSAPAIHRAAIDRLAERAAALTGK